MGKVSFDKPALSIDEQVERLRDRGLRADRDELADTLRRISYYRLSGYLWWFYTDVWEEITPGTTLADVMRLYDFDAGLRALVMEMAHPIEAWLGSAFANHTAVRYGPMGYLDAQNFSGANAFRKDLAKLDDELGRREKPRFISHFQEKYSDQRPPVWMAAELMSLGQLSKWFANIDDGGLRKAIASEVGLPERVLRSFLRSFTVYRNLAAHHSRLWNQRPSVQILDYRNPPELLRAALGNGADRACIQYCLAIAVYVVRRICGGDDLVPRLRDHLAGAKQDWLDEMDFPEGFQDAPLWNPPGG